MMQHFPEKSKKMAWQGLLTVSLIAEVGQRRE
jgi:hypothetical protein